MSFSYQGMLTYLLLASRPNSKKVLVMAMVTEGSVVRF